MSDWQPIETAPTAPDDPSLLLWIPNRFPHVVVGAYWQMEETRWGWWAEGRQIQPSHWMPLPDPPATTTKEGA